MQVQTFMPIHTASKADRQGVLDGRSASQLVVGGWLGVDDVGSNIPRVSGVLEESIVLRALCV